MDYAMKCKVYTRDTNLSGSWVVSYKIDGIQLRIDVSGAFSRAGNRQKNIEVSSCFRDLEPGVYEFFRTSWNESTSLLNNSARVAEIKLSDFYRIDVIDSRLLVCGLDNPTYASVDVLYQRAKSLGYEGIVLRKGSTYYKKKAVLTVDVRVIGVEEGRGRNKGRLGAAVTTRGNVGVGFSDTQRKAFFIDANFVGSIIEVECMEFTKHKKMRHARFVRLRNDKDEENLDG